MNVCGARYDVQNILLCLRSGFTMKSLMSRHVTGRELQPSSLLFSLLLLCWSEMWNPVWPKTVEAPSHWRMNLDAIVSCFPETRTQIYNFSLQAWVREKMQVSSPPVMLLLCVCSLVRLEPTSESEVIPALILKMDRIKSRETDEG